MTGKDGSYIYFIHLFTGQIHHGMRKNVMFQNKFLLELYSSKEVLYQLIFFSF